MRPGSVLVDLGASELGGNVDGSQPDQTVVTDNGVTIVGAGNLPSQVPTASSFAFSNNVTALLSSLVHEGALKIDLDDAVQAGVVITFEGQVVHPEVAKLVEKPATSGTRGGKK
jgi:NAD(P) transhydrogenase subunit alpha